MRNIKNVVTTDNKGGYCIFLDSRKMENMERQADSIKVPGTLLTWSHLATEDVMPFFAGSESFSKALWLQDTYYIFWMSKSKGRGR